MSSIIYNCKYVNTPNGNPCRLQWLENDDYSLMSPHSLCTDVTMVGEIQAHQSSVPGFALPL